MKSKMFFNKMLNIILTPFLAIITIIVYVGKYRSKWYRELKKEILDAESRSKK